MQSLLADVDWQEMFIPTKSMAEMILRGSLMYLILFALLRIILKREAGGIGITDVLVIVLLADAAQNAMAAEYRSIPEGTVLVATIILWAYALDWLGYRFPAVERLIHPSPLPLIKDGRILHRNLRQELITMEQLMTKLRMQGIEDPREVKRAYMEPDGSISIIPYDKDKHNPQPQHDKTRH